MNHPIYAARTAAKHSARAGHTLIEVAISATLLFVLAAALVESIAGVRALAVKGDLDARLQSTADAAMARMRGELRTSAFTNVFGKQYPHTFVAGDAGSGFDAHDHAPAQQREPVPAAGHVPASDGPSREIVFLHPVFTQVQQGSDGVNHPIDDASVAGPIAKIYAVPELDSNGDIVWAPDEISFVVVTRPDGRNVLERRVNGDDAKVIARFVERVTFETSAEDPVNVPLGAVRVRLWLQEKDHGGTLHHRFAESILRLRNG